MGNQVGVQGGGNLSEQLRVAKGKGVTTNTIPPAVQTGTVTGAAFDRNGANAMTAVFNVGAIGSAGNYTVKVQDSADGSTGWGDLASSTQGFGAVATAAGALATANTDVVLTTDLRGAKRYVRHLGTLVSGTSVLWGAAVILGAFETLPESSN